MTSVELKYYDLSRGMASHFASFLMGMNLEGVWHTAILFGGREWFYGGGIQCARPEQVQVDYGMTPVKTEVLGQTTKTVDEFKAWCRSQEAEFSPDNYSFLEHNCNHFTDAAARFLTGRGIPEAVLKQHEVIQAHPTGRMIIAVLDNLQKEAGRRQEDQGLMGFLNTGRLPPESEKRMQVPKWTDQPGPFELVVKRLWNDPEVSQPVKCETCYRLRLLAKNAKDAPLDLRYRTVRETNAKLRQSVLAHAYGPELFAAMGFQRVLNPETQSYDYTLGQEPKLSAEMIRHLTQCETLLWNFTEADITTPQSDPTMEKFNKIKTAVTPLVGKAIEALTGKGGNSPTQPNTPTKH